MCKSRLAYQITCNTDMEIHDATLQADIGNIAWLQAISSTYVDFHGEVTFLHESYAQFVHIYISVVVAFTEFFKIYQFCWVGKLLR